MKFASATCLLLCATAASAQTRISGRVFNSQGAAIRGVRVILEDSLKTRRFEAVSDSAGGFDVSVTGLPARLFVTTDMLGYGPVDRVAVDINAKNPPFLELELAEEAVALRPLKVTARKPPADYLSEFRKRADQVKKGGGGYVLEREQLARGGQQSVARLLAAVPGVRYVASRNGSSESVLSTRGNCAPRIYLDGTPLVVNNISMISAESLEGVEVYAGLGLGPAEYFDRTGCGVVLLWSQRGKPAGDVHYPLIGIAVIVSVITILLSK